MAAREIFNIKSIKAKKFDTIDMGVKYTTVFGKPESKFTAMCYGPSGSGKSVYALGMAQCMAENFGKVLYNSHEEKVNQTIKDRIINFDIDADKLYFGNSLKFERMIDKIQRNYYRAVIIDSVQYMDFTYDQLKELRITFAKRKLAIIMVSFGTLDNPTGGKDLLHASDIKLFFSNGKLNAKSRYTQKPVNVQLFNPNQDQLKLF